MDNPVWPADTKAYRHRQVAIMQNGNEGTHYWLVEVDRRLTALSKEIDRLEQARREYINRHDLNKVGV